MADIEKRRKGNIKERVFPTAKDMQDSFEEYWDICQAIGDIASKPGFFLHAGIKKSTFSKYLERYGDEYAMVAENIANKLQVELIRSGMDNPKSNAMQIFLLKAQHGYTDRPSNVVNVGVQANLDFSTMKDSDLKKMRQIFFKNREAEEND